MKNRLTLELFRGLTRYLHCFSKHSYGYLSPQGFFALQCEHPVWVIVAPELTQSVVATLPVNTSAEAFRYAASYFEMTTDDVFYNVQSLGEKRYLFSRCEAEVLRKWVNHFELPIALIEGFVFSQEAFGEIEVPIVTSKNSALVRSDGAVVSLSLNYVTHSQRLDILDALRALKVCVRRFRVEMKTSQEVTKKSAIWFLALSSIVTLNGLFQGYLYWGERQKLSVSIEITKTQNLLPQTMMELDGQVEKWVKKETAQIKLRNSIGSLAALTLSGKGSSLENNELATPVLLPPVPTQIKTDTLLPPPPLSSLNLAIAPSIQGDGEYFESMEYQNGNLNFVIHAPSPKRAEEIRGETLNALKGGRIGVKENLVVGSVE